MAISKLAKLYAQMAELTKQECQKGCYTLPMKGYIGGCCSSMYCRLAKKISEAQGQTAPEFFTDEYGDPTYLHPDGSGCVIEPHLRPLCTLHTCEKFLWQNPEFKKTYFRLRNRLNKEENKCNPMRPKSEI